MAKTENKATAPADADDKTPATPKAKKNSGPMLKVRAKIAGFRRGGRSWPDVETLVPVADFSDDQVKAILAELALVAEIVDAKPEK